MFTCVACRGTGALAHAYPNMLQSQVHTCTHKHTNQAHPDVVVEHLHLLIPTHDIKFSLPSLYSQHPKAPRSPHKPFTPGGHFLPASLGWHPSLQISASKDFLRRCFYIYFLPRHRTQDIHAVYKKTCHVDFVY